MVQTSAAELFAYKTPGGGRNVADHGQQGLEVLFALVVYGLLQMDGVELALGGADAAAYAEVLVHDNTAASEAAIGFLLDLLLGKSSAQILEGLDSLGSHGFGRTLAGAGVETVDGECQSSLVERLVVSGIAAVEESLTGVYVAVNGNCGFFAGRDGIDGEPGTGDGVTARENVCLGGLVCLGIGQDVALFTGLEIEACQIYLLADGAYDAVNCNAVVLAGEELDLSVSALDFNRLVLEEELDALCLCFGNLGGVCGHVLFLAAVYDWFGDYRINEITCQKPAQCGFTDMAVDLILWICENDPSPTALFLADRATAIKLMEYRIKPALKGMGKLKKDKKGQKKEATMFECRMSNGFYLMVSWGSSIS